jgi:hypothetical protein
MKNKPDETKLRQAICHHFPKLASAHFRILTHSWDSVAVDVDDQLIFKFPRDDQAEAALRREVRFLDYIRPRVKLTVPDMRLFEGSPVFSMHPKIAGEHLQNDAQLSRAGRAETATRLGEFYAQLHQLDPDIMTSRGAMLLPGWGPANSVLHRALVLLPAHLHDFAHQTTAAWSSLGPDPHGITYGFFDGHGWNMAFDLQAQRLNGIFDFADSGLGPVHQEFVYSSLTSPALTAGIIIAYENASGRKLDRHRIWTLTAMHRLWELVDPKDGAEHMASKIARVEAWAKTDVAILLQKEPKPRM